MDRAARERVWVRDWRPELLRTGLGALGTLVALTIAGWPSNAAEAAWVGVGGLVIGLLVAFAVEYLHRLRTDALAMRRMAAELDAERQQRAEERRLWERQLALARREAAILAVDVEVWGGAHSEAVGTGHVLPLSAILARRDVPIKARNLDYPLPD